MLYDLEFCDLIIVVDICEISKRLICFDKKFQIDWAIIARITKLFRTRFSKTLVVVKSRVV